MATKFKFLMPMEDSAPSHPPAMLLVLLGPWIILQIELDSKTVNENIK